MKKGRVILFLSVFILISNFLFAQDKKENPVSLSLDLMSRYVWRGTDYGASPSIQPGIEFSKKGFALGTWGAYTVNSPGIQETDIYASYTYDMFSVILTDYFFPNENADYNYFDYKSSSTGHVLEATLAFNGTDNFPLSVFVATNFYGADALRINNDGTTGDIQYSTYAEISYDFQYFTLFTGANLTKPDTNIGESGYYGNSAGIVNLGIKTVRDIKITENFSLPLSVSLITNPQAEKIYLIAGFSF